MSFGHGLLYPPGVALLVFLDRGERARVVRDLSRIDMAIGGLAWRWVVGSPGRTLLR